MAKKNCSQKKGVDKLKQTECLEMCFMRQQACP